MLAIKLHQSFPLALAALALTPTTSFAASIVFADAGADAASIADTVDDFRTALGEPDNINELGPIAEGRREINWDAGIVPFDMPGDFFNTTVPRGAEFTTDAGSEFRVSNPINPDDPGFPDNEFDSINPTYPDQFITFSPERLFTAVDTNVMDVHFFVSGTDTPATTNGFGAIFTDVDLADSTLLEFFDIDGNVIGSNFVPTAPEGLSFYGEIFEEENLFSVRITSGNTPVGPDDDPTNGIDIVVMDNFFYGEPQEAVADIPEPSSILGLLTLGAITLGIRGKRSTKTQD